jgi:serine/threonine-protein kinase
LALPENAPLAVAGRSTYGVSGHDIAISPDGSRIVYNADTGTTSQLFVRHFDRFDAEALPGTDGSSYPFFSPDGRWVGYFTEEKLMKAPLDGGQPVAVADVRVTSGATWGGDGYIYLTHHESDLARVAENGGPLESLDLKDFGSQLVGAWLQWLPDGALLVTSTDPSSSFDHGQAVIQHVALGTGRVTPLVRGGFHGHYTPSGHLIFARGNGLYAAPVDLERLELTGPPTSVLEGVWTDSVWGVALFAASEDGTLAYAVGENWGESIPTWIDLDGNEEPLPVPPQIYGTPNVSPGGDQVAIHVMGTQDQVHVYDSTRRSLSRLTLSGTNVWPVWSTDGREVLFARSVEEEQVWGLFEMSVDRGDSPAPVIPHTEVDGKPTAISPDGRTLLVARDTPGRSVDIWLVSLDGESEHEPFQATEFAEWGARFSPDGRWIAFTSDKRGPYEVFVRPYPANDREWQVSVGGGEEPRWARDGKTLLMASSLPERRGSCSRRLSTTRPDHPSPSVPTVVSSSTSPRPRTSR